MGVELCFKREWAPYRSNLSLVIDANDEETLLSFDELSCRDDARIVGIEVKMP